MLWGKSDRFDVSKSTSGGVSYNVSMSLIKKSHNRQCNPTRPPFSPSSSSASQRSLNNRTNRSTRSLGGHYGDSGYPERAQTRPAVRSKVNSPRIKGLRPGSALEGGSLISLGQEEAFSLGLGDKSRGNGAESPLSREGSPAPHTSSVGRASPEGMKSVSFSPDTKTAPFNFRDFDSAMSSMVSNRTAGKVHMTAAQAAQNAPSLSRKSRDNEEKAEEQEAPGQAQYR